MTPEILIVTLILVATLVLLISERISLDLTALGITDYGEFRQTGQAMPGQPNAL